MTWSCCWLMELCGFLFDEVIYVAVVDTEGEGDHFGVLSHGVCAM